MLKSVILLVLTVLVNTIGGLPQNYLAKLPITGSFPNAIVNKSIRFAIIGDYGNTNADTVRVARLVKSWNPDFIITVGDNSYAGGACCRFDDHVGQKYQEYIYPYKGIYGPGAAKNRFFPTLGDHDWVDQEFQSYIEFFTLPGNERYYDFAEGPVHIFVTDILRDEPDGYTPTSIQGQWLQKKLATSTEPWKLIFTHKSPYSSGELHGSNQDSQWPFQEWGATATFSGHDHLYERLSINGYPYFVNGLGGVSKHNFERPPLAGSQVRYNASYGALLVTANTCSITFAFYSLESNTIPVDHYAISRCVEV